MKRYEFRAAKVLRVRRLQEDIARAGVAAARHSEQLAREALATTQQRYADLAAPIGQLSSASFLASRQHAEFRATAVVAAQHDERAALDATAQAVSTWHQAHRKVDGLERLDERRREDYAVEVGRAHDAVVDEIVVARARRSA